MDDVGRTRAKDHKEDNHWHDLETDSGRDTVGEREAKKRIVDRDDRSDAPRTEHHPGRHPLDAPKVAHLPRRYTHLSPPPPSRSV